MKVAELGATRSSLTVVVPTSDFGGKWLRQCIKSIRRSPGCEVGIVAVESSGSRFNFALSVNEGIARAAGDVLVLNDDASLAVGTLDALSRARERYGEGIYQTYVHCTDGTPHDIGWSFDSGMTAFLKTAVASLMYTGRGPARRAALRALAMTNVYPFTYHKSPTDGFDGFSFNATMITGGALRTLGRLDEGFPLGYDDIDYSLRCHLAGVPYYCVPRAVVYHVLNGSRKGGDPRELPSYQRLRSKWPRSLLLKTLEKGPKGRVIW